MGLKGVYPQRQAEKFNFVSEMFKEIVTKLRHPKNQHF